MTYESYFLHRHRKMSWNQIKELLKNTIRQWTCFQIGLLSTSFNYIAKPTTMVASISPLTEFEMLALLKDLFLVASVQNQYNDIFFTKTSPFIFSRKDFTFFLPFEDIVNLNSVLLLGFDTAIEGPLFNLALNKFNNLKADSIFQIGLKTKTTFKSSTLGLSFNGITKILKSKSCFSSSLIEQNISGSILSSYAIFFGPSFIYRSDSADLKILSDLILNNVQNTETFYIPTQFTSSNALELGIVY
jgi:hypothetical protein